MDLLPDELLLMLMRTVADQPHWGVPSVLTLSEVSRKFLRVARDPVLWKFLVDRDCHQMPMDDELDDEMLQGSLRDSDNGRRRIEQLPALASYRAQYLTEASRFRYHDYCFFSHEAERKDSVP